MSLSTSSTGIYNPAPGIEFISQTVSAAAELLASSTGQESVSAAAEPVVDDSLAHTAQLAAGSTSSSSTASHLPPIYLPMPDTSAGSEWTQLNGRSWNRESEQWHWNADWNQANQWTRQQWKNQTPSGPWNQAPTSQSRQWQWSHQHGQPPTWSRWNGFIRESSVWSSNLWTSRPVSWSIQQEDANGGNGNEQFQFQSQGKWRVREADFAQSWKPEQQDDLQSNVQPRRVRHMHMSIDLREVRRPVVATGESGSDETSNQQRVASQPQQDAEPEPESMGDESLQNEQKAQSDRPESNQKDSHRWMQQRFSDRKWQHSWRGIEQASNHQQWPMNYEPESESESEAARQEDQETQTTQNQRQRQDQDDTEPDWGPEWGKYEIQPSQLQQRKERQRKEQQLKSAVAEDWNYNWSIY